MDNYDSHTANIKGSDYTFTFLNKVEWVYLYYDVAITPAINLKYLIDNFPVEYYRNYRNDAYEECFWSILNKNGSAYLDEHIISSFGEIKEFKVDFISYTGESVISNETRCINLKAIGTIDNQPYKYNYEHKEYKDGLTEPYNKGVFTKELTDLSI